MNLDNIRIVLVSTSHPGNIGGVARAMKNMGLSRLYLVAPRQYPHEQADWRAASASDVLESAVVTDTLDEAIGDCPLPLDQFLALSARPDLAKATWDFARIVLAEGQLPPTVSRLVVAAIALHTGCDSCPSTAEQCLASLGLDPASLDGLISPPSPDPSSEADALGALDAGGGGAAALPRSILSFATKAGADPLAVTDDDVRSLGEAGLADGELVELALTIAFAKLMNTWADVAAMAAALDEEAMTS